MLGKRTRGRKRIQLIYDLLEKEELQLQNIDLKKAVGEQ